MDESDIIRPTFIVRLWQEKENIDPNDSEYFWRGSVTHVPSGLSHYFQDFDDIGQFIRSYLGINQKRFTFDLLMQSLRALLKG